MFFICGVLILKTLPYVRTVDHFPQRSIKRNSVVFGIWFMEGITNSFFEGLNNGLRTMIRDVAEINFTSRRIDLGRICSI